MTRILLDVAPDNAADLFDAELRARMAAVGDVVEGRDGSVDDDARRAFDILVTGWGSRPLPAELGEGDRLRLVVHSAGTIRAVIPRPLIERGLPVSQAAAGMVVSVAESALYATMALLRSWHRVDRAMHGARDWALASSHGLTDTVAGAAIGVVGGSRIGRAYIGLVRALGADVLLYDPYVDGAAARGLGVTVCPLDDLLSASDLVSLHAPVTPETTGMIDGRRLALLRDGGRLVNTARSALLDSRALARELVSGRLEAALDVFDDEPLPADSPLWGLPNVLLTPHLGAVTRHSRRTQGTIVVEEIERFAAGLPLRHAVGPATYDLLA